MTDNSTSALVRRCFRAYETADRAAIESLLAPDFTFTSPQDDTIDRAAYFKRCWPFSASHPAIAIEKLFVSDNEAFVTYRCATAEKTFRNTEFFVLNKDQIRAVTVYFGRTL